MLQSISQLSALTGFDRRIVTARLESLAPAPGPGRAKRYRSAEALPLLYAVGDLDPRRERARLDAARADLAEADLAKKRGQLLDVDEVRALWIEETTRLRSKLLHLPVRVAPTVLGLEDLREAERCLRDHIHAALAEISKIDGTP